MCTFPICDLRVSKVDFFPPQHIRCPMLLVNLVPVIFRAFSEIFSHFLETHGKYTNYLL